MLAGALVGLTTLDHGGRTEPAALGGYAVCRLAWYGVLVCKDAGDEK